MIGIKIKAKETGKSPTKLSHDLQIELQRSRNSCLEAIRKELVKAAPSKSKGNKFSQNRIRNYLNSPTNCIRKRGRYGGYVFLDQRKLPHLKYLVKDTRERGLIEPKGKMMFFIKPWGEKVWTYWVHGYAANTFIEKAYIRSKRWVRYYSKRHIETAIMKK